MKLLIITGKSCSGKTTIANHLKTLGFIKIITTTTRPIREGEVDGRDYHFIDESEFLVKIEQGEFLEHTLRGKHYYGMEKSELLVGGKVLAIVDPRGVTALKKFTKGNCLAIYIDSREKERERRALHHRRMDSKEWDMRRIIEERDFETIYGKVDVVVDNSYNCLPELKGILKRFSY